MKQTRWLTLGRTLLFLAAGAPLLQGQAKLPPPVPGGAQGQGPVAGQGASAVQATDRNGRVLPAPAGRGTGAPAVAPDGRGGAVSPKEDALAPVGKAGEAPVPADREGVERKGLVAPAPEPPAAPAPDGQDQLRQLRSGYRGPWILASDLFTGPTSFNRIGAATVADDYRVGIGDEMMMYVFGASTFEQALKVDGSGRVAIPRVGSTHVAGLRLGDVRRAIQALVNGVFGGSRVDLQFAKTRDVRVFILGEVWRPGSYVVPSMTSILNVLLEAGGPSAVGSFRKIQVIRGGNVLHTLDLYPLRLKGTGMENLMLQDGDTLFVPMHGPRILVDGAFQRVAAAPQAADAPGVLVEITERETAWDVVQLAGGLAPGAFQGLLSLQRKGADGVINIRDLPTGAEALKKVQLFDEDMLRAHVQVERHQGLVEVGGHARVPGVFQHWGGMRVAELLSQTGQIQPDTFMGRAQVVRTLDDGSTELHAFDLAAAMNRDPVHNLVLQPRDRVELYRTTDLRLRKTVKVLGPFSKPGVYDWHNRMRASDLIFMAGVPQLNADRYHAELAHMGQDGQPSQVVKLDLAKLLYSADGPVAIPVTGEANPLLQPFDQITLYEIPDFKVHRTITISGQVKQPGSYVLTDRKVTLRQLIERAGGLTGEAMPAGGIFLRNALKDRDLTPGQLEKAGVESVDPTGQGVNEILARLNETKRTKDTGQPINVPVMHSLMTGAANRLVVDFKAALEGDARKDVELMDGDQVVIPRKAESAYVVGEVASPFASFRVQPGDRVKDVVTMAGGFTRNADTSQVRLLKADGRIVDSWVMSAKVEPGDAVLVPQRLRVNTTWQDNLQALTPLALILNAIRR